MISPHEYLEQILAEIDRAKASGRTGVFKMREKLTDEVANYAKNYLEAHTNYRIEFHKCRHCAFEWDVIIIF